MEHRGLLCHNALMELRDFALSIVSSDKLKEKLSPPPSRMTDDNPGPVVRIE